jgi:hypothetical protein
MTAALTYQISDPATLSAARRAEVFALFQRCYDCVDFSSFEEDLRQKTSIILLIDENHHVVGFSTQQIYQRIVSGEPIRVLYSGDTVIDPAHWGSQLLVKAWCEVAAQALHDSPALRTFWFLISKGCRTYLYLPLFFRTFLPSAIDQAPVDQRKLLDQLAAEKFGTHYDAATGLIRFPQSRGQLTPELATIPAGRQNDLHVQHFLRCNPDFAQGVELACLAEISLENTHGFGRRWLGRALASVAHSAS